MSALSVLTVAVSEKEITKPLSFVTQREKNYNSSTIKI